MQWRSFFFFEEYPLRNRQEPLWVRHDLMQFECSGPKEVEGTGKEAVERVLVEHLRQVRRLPMVAGVRPVQNPANGRVRWNLRVIVQLLEWGRPDFRITGKEERREIAIGEVGSGSAT